MKPSFTDLPIEVQQSFGNGCSFVPDFIFTASCQHHDFSYVRGYRLKDKLKADFDMCRHIWSDSSKWWHYLVSVIYWLGLTFLPFSYLFFHWNNRYRTIEEIIQIDKEDKMSWYNY